MFQNLPALILVFLAGMAVAIQTPINGLLAQTSGNGIFAATVSFLVGTLALAVILLSSQQLPSPASLRAVPWWMWTGGLLGAFYVWAALSNVHRIGALSLVAALIAGQLTAALILDAAGAIGLSASPISWQRIVAVFLVAGGVLLSRF